MGLHSFFEGVAFGVSLKTEEQLNMLFAILAHKWSEALTVGVSFVAAEIPKNASIKYMIFYSIITPAGILLGCLISFLNNNSLVGIF